MAAIVPWRCVQVPLKLLSYTLNPLCCSQCIHGGLRYTAEGLEAEEEAVLVVQAVGGMQQHS